MKIFSIASELYPFAKTGGLADVVASLAAALRKKDHDVRLLLPYYASAHQVPEPVRQLPFQISVPIGPTLPTATVWETRLPGTTVPVYLLRYYPYYDRDRIYGTPHGAFPDNAERFTFLSRASLEILKRLDWAPDILHLHDWQTALVPVYLRTYYQNDECYSRTRTVFTIHNLAYQGHFDRPYLDRVAGLPDRLFTPEALEFYGKFNFLKGGLVFADRLTTVSPRYAEEIQEPEHGNGMDGVLRARARDLTGILNGIDPTVWNPETDALLPARYSWQDLAGKARCKNALQLATGLTSSRDTPVVGMISRLAEQKGVDLVIELIPWLMAQNVQLVILGQGEARYQEALLDAAADHPGQMHFSLSFDNPLAHLIEAGADLFLMPSRYEPCGLNQLYSLAYGTVPVVHATGGLADTVSPWTLDAPEGSATGFVFSPHTVEAFQEQLALALELYRTDPAGWTRLLRTGMRQDWTWDRSASRYEAIYRELAEIARHPRRPQKSNRPGKKRGSSRAKRTI